MKKIEVITRPEKLVGLKEIFATHNCQGMTCLSVMGCGRQKGYLPEMNFTGDDINLLPKIMVLSLWRMTRLRKFWRILPQRLEPVKMVMVKYSLRKF